MIRKEGKKVKLNLNLDHIEAKKKYCLVDLYENPLGDIVGYYDTVKEVRAAGIQYEKDADGECRLVVGVDDTQ